MEVKVLLVMGTRPEAIKLAPVHRALLKRDIETRVCSTRQQWQLLSDAMDVFGIEPDYEFPIGKPSYLLSPYFGEMMSNFDIVLHDYDPDWTIVQGDTNSAMAGALASYYKKIRVAHVEAGLRTSNIYAPFPEEGNRRMISQISNMHFAPTDIARHHLLISCITDKKIHVVGNTVVDALNMIPESEPEIGGRYVLVTAHRRENFGQPLENICRAIRSLALSYSDVKFIFSVHPNASVDTAVHKNLRMHKPPNMFLLSPPEYTRWINLMRHAYMIMTDSGGIQEEAPSFGVPVLVMRDVTERPEAAQLGYAKVVGTNTDVIVSQARSLLNNKAERDSMSAKSNPYGDGRASERIVEVLLGEH